MTQRFGKWPKYLGNGLDVWDTCFRNGFTMLNWLMNLTNGLNMWEMKYLCGKWLKCLRND